MKIVTATATFASRVRVLGRSGFALTAWKQKIAGRSKSQMTHYRSMVAHPLAIVTLPSECYNLCVSLEKASTDKGGQSLEST